MVRSFRLSADNDKQALLYLLAEEASSETAIIFGELDRNQGELKICTVGQRYASGLRGIALDFGVSVQ
ncbi:TerD family protein [Embleya sp. NPDC001921]